MYLKNKKGVILIETMIFLGIITIMIILFSKQNIMLIDKAKYYEIKEDILTLTYNEIVLLEEVESEINSNEELNSKVLEFIDDNSKIFQYKKQSTEDSNLMLQFRFGGLTLCSKYDKNHSIIHKLDIKILDSEVNKVIILIPNNYKIIYRER